MEALWKTILERDFDGCLDKRGNGRTSLETYKYNLPFKLQKKALFEEETSPSRIERGYRNSGDCIAALCMRGELGALQKKLEPAKIDEQIPYYSWVYYGNYSSPWKGVICFSERQKIFLPTVFKHFKGSLAEKKKLWPTALHWACLGAQLEIVKYLCSIEGINLEARIGDLNATPLDIAVKNGYIDVARYMRSEVDKKKLK